MIAPTASPRAQLSPDTLPGARRLLHLNCGPQLLAPIAFIFRNAGVAHRKKTQHVRKKFFKRE